MKPKVSRSNLGLGHLHSTYVTQHHLLTCILRIHTRSTLNRLHPPLFNLYVCMSMYPEVF